MKEKIIKINVSEIADFPKHLFKINNNLNYEELKESIKENGVLVTGSFFFFFFFQFLFHRKA